MLYEDARKGRRGKKTTPMKLIRAALSTSKN